jgi:tetratricopeptide (TPR) repeat protein
MEYEKNLQEIEELLVQFGITRESCPMNENSQPCLSPLGMLLSYAKKCFTEHRYDECAKLLHAILKIVPNEPEALALLHDAEKRWEDQQMAEELAIHVENVRKEAMDQFDRGNFHECIGKFQFLREIEPGNPLYADFLQLSLEELKLSPSPAPPQAPTVSSLGVEGQLWGPVFGKIVEEIITPSELAAATLGILEKPVPEVIVPEIEIQSESKSFQTSATALPSAVAEVQQFSPEDIDEAWAELFRLKEMVEGEPEEKTAGASANEAAEPTVAVTSPNPPLAAATPDAIPPETRESSIEGVAPQPRRYWPLLAAAAILLIACLPAFFFVLKKKPADESTTAPAPNCQLVINSEPAGAVVYLDGVKVGETNLSLLTLSAGKHQLRVEKADFQTLMQDLVLTPQSTPQLSLTLIRIPVPETDPASLAASLKELLRQKRFWEASQRCDQLATTDPANPLVKESRSKIRQHYLQSASRSLAAQKWEEARLSLENLLKIFPGDNEARNRMRSLKDKVKAIHTASAAEQSLKNRIQDLQGQLARALNGGNYLPPQSPNALDLTRQLLEISPAHSAAVDAQNQILREMTGQAQNRMTSKDLEGARSLLNQLQNHFPDSAELNNLRAQLRNEELKHQNQFNNWIQKAEAAMTAGQFVSPSQDNAVLYCNRVLSLDPQRTAASELKQEAFRRAGQKGGSLISSGKYEEARDLYATLLAFSQHEKSFPVDPQEIKKELTKLEFHNWQVIHDHAIGSCHGKLRFNGYLIAFVPAGDSRDGFTAKLTEVVQTESGDRLKIQLKNKTYRFQINSSTNREENREKLTSLQREMASLMALLEK